MTNRAHTIRLKWGGRALYRSEGLKAGSEVTNTELLFSGAGAAGGESL